MKPAAYQATGVPEPENKRFYPALDGLRACAVLMVFAQHYVLMQIPGIWQWGWAGVDVFFVLSGFLITGILFDTKDSDHRFRNFYVRRTLRIFPLYYGVLLLVLLLTPFMHWNWNITWAYWPFYLQNYVRFFYSTRFAESGGTLEALVFLSFFCINPSGFCWAISGRWAWRNNSILGGHWSCSP